MGRVLFSAACYFALMAWAKLGFTQDNPPPQEIAEYRVLPHRVDNDRLPPVSSSMLLNGQVVNHLTEWQAEGLVLTGESRNTTVTPRLLYTTDSHVQQSVTGGNVFRSVQESDYLQLRGAQNDRRVQLRVKEPKTMLGMTMQSTLTGKCAVLGQESSTTDAQCSYTPSLAVNRESLDPDFFLPTTIIQGSALGQEVSPETLLLLAQPGFQNVGADGEIIGLDFYLPNIGLLPGNEQTNATRVRRSEEYGNTPQISYSRVQQVLQSNADTALFTRTVRGLPYLHDNEQAGLAPLLGLVGQWLPDLAPDLSGSVDEHDTRINLNLLRASNNSWLPGNSWTIYQSGMGYSPHPEVGAQPPDVWFNNLWIGMSPVTERSASFRNFLQPTSAPAVIGAAGAEGGSIKPLHLVIEDEQGMNIIDTKLLPSGIDDFYLQMYLSMTSRDADLVSISNLREQTNWYSHVSYSGNLTSNNFLWRYYAGTIRSQDPKSYIGSDYIHNISDWSIGVGAVYYTDQDVDYFSQVSASVSRNLDLFSNWESKTYIDWRYAYDRKPTVSALVFPPENYSRVGFRLDYNSRASLDIYHYFNGLNDAIEASPGADFSYQLRDGWSLRSWLHPGNQVESRGIGMEYQIQRSKQKITMGASWFHQAQEYGNDPFFNNLKTEQDMFMFRIELSR